MPFPTQFCKRKLERNNILERVTYCSSSHGDEDKEASPVGGGFDEVDELGLTIQLFHLNDSTDLLVFVLDKLIVHVSVGVVLCKHFHCLFCFAVMYEPLHWSAYVAVNIET